MYIRTATFMYDPAKRRSCYASMFQAKIAVRISGERKKTMRLRGIVIGAGWAGKVIRSDCAMLARSSSVMWSYT